MLWPYLQIWDWKLSVRRLWSWLRKAMVGIECDNSVSGNYNMKCIPQERLEPFLILRIPPQKWFQPIVDGLVIVVLMGLQLGWMLVSYFPLV